MSTPRRVLVLGATSELAQRVVSELCAAGPCELVLAARDGERLAAVAEQLRRDGCARVETLALEALRTDQHPALIEQAFALLGGVDVALVAVGALGDRGGVPDDVPAALDVLRVNLVGAGSLLLESALRMRTQGSGTLVVLSSVAAERPRRANVVYGASKAGLDALAQGLGDALQGTGVGVLVVRPGFVSTRMTEGLSRPPLSTTPDAVARATLRALERGSHTVWVPGALRWVMAAVRHLPRRVFRKLSL